MKKESLEFLTELLETPSPSGFETKIQAVVKKRMKPFADSISGDVHGNVFVSLNAKAPLRVMLAGHCDQIGMMIHHIDKNGYCYVGQIGGLDPTVLPASQVTVHTKNGPIAGVIGHKPAHLVPQEDRGKKVELKKLWIDIGAKDGDEAKSIVCIGDPVTYKLGVVRLGKHALCSPGCDNRVGLFVVMEALRLVSEKVKDKGKLPVALHAVSTVQEEIGLRGARTASYSIDPLVGIAVDVTHASDNPGADAVEIGTVTLGDGPTIARGANINPVLEQLLVSAAEKNKIKFQRLASPGATGTDANAMQVNRSGVAAALVGIPNRYMHSCVEVVDLRDLEAAAELIAETVLAIKANSNFIPE